MSESARYELTGHLWEAIRQRDAAEAVFVQAVTATPIHRRTADEAAREMSDRDAEIASLKQQLLAMDTEAGRP